MGALVQGCTPATVRAPRTRALGVVPSQGRRSVLAHQQQGHDAGIRTLRNFRPLGQQCGGVVPDPTIENGASTTSAVYNL